MATWADDMATAQDEQTAELGTDLGEDRGTDLGEETARTLARVADLITAQRVELFQITAGLRGSRTNATMIAWWRAHDMPDARSVDDQTVLSTSWFPWSLGNIPSDREVFIRNAGPLPTDPTCRQRLRDLGIESALYLPLHYSDELIGALCCGWREERSGWDREHLEKLQEWGTTVLSPPPTWGSWMANEREPDVSLPRSLFGPIERG